MKKRILAAVVTVVLAAAVLAGCGSKEKEAKTIKVAASAVPHAEILEAAKPLMEAKGYTLEVKVFDDYIPTWWWSPKSLTATISSTFRILRASTRSRERIW